MTVKLPRKSVITNESIWALSILEEQGLQYDSSIFPIRSKRYGIPDAPVFPYRIQGTKLIEIPLSTIRIFGSNLPICGGGYLRLLPYWLTKQAIKRINREGRPVIIYTHPHELDTEELKILKSKIPIRARLGQGLNRGKTEYKLKQLGKDFKLGSIRDIINNFHDE